MQLKLYHRILQIVGLFLCAQLGYGVRLKLMATKLVADEEDCASLLKGAIMGYFHDSAEAPIVEYKECWQDNNYTIPKKEILDKLDTAAEDLKYIKVLTSPPQTGLKYSQNSLTGEIQIGIDEAFEVLQLVITKAQNCSFLNKIHHRMAILLQALKHPKKVQINYHKDHSMLAKNIRINCEERCYSVGRAGYYCTTYHCKDFTPIIWNLFAEYENDHYYLVGYYLGEILLFMEVQNSGIKFFSNIYLYILLLVILYIFRSE